ncbi:transmembrane protein 185A isoform X1 [Patella vulgata]|uniref:transmembrane protein 185A isoform X1 n=2 Tax=Patella vulgata TaxID=6465 RepID=UPI00217F7962|nr:transmembrane protein 185A isoform X1 [Patella vulgata]
MNLKNLFQDFNPSKFLVFTCLLVFCLLFSLRLDGTIEWSYWVIFLPIWLWKVMVIAGALVGSYVWWKNPHYRGEGDSYVQYKAMVMCTGLHMLLLMFEILACDNLETNNHSWILVFIPLMFMSVVSISICIWAVKNERAFEMELFCSVNILQFIFLALRLDKVFQWSWVIVFIPIWIVMCVTLIGLLYAIVLAIILLKSPDIIPEQRRGNVSTAVGYFFLVVPLLVFEILLANRLDHANQFKFSAITVPLLMSLITLICLSFGSKGGNHWWFGVRKDFCQFVLGVCPFLQEYGNISYSLHSNDSDNDSTTSQHVKTKSSLKKSDYIVDQPRTVISVLSIEMPD